MILVKTGMLSFFVLGIFFFVAIFLCSGEDLQ